MTGPHSLRPIRPSDLSAVMEIGRRSLPSAWGEAMWREELNSAFGLYLVAGHPESEEVVGYVGLKLVADEAHVMTLAVRPEDRRRGLAKALVGAALEEAESSGARVVHLEVRPSNAAARALYASFGFRETGVRKNYYGNEDALLMSLHLREGLLRR